VSTRDMRSGSRAGMGVDARGGIWLCKEAVVISQWTMLGNIVSVKLRLLRTTRQRLQPRPHAPPRRPRCGLLPSWSPPMANLKSAFDQAVAESKQLPDKPDNATLLQIYSLYKQATEGDVEGKRPGFTDMVGRAKYDAWAGQKGKSTEDAMQEYVDLIESLK
jgi:diazepam-binding inhibitor (GABA receptor modulator, acyl-CoA-binding protein)